METNDIWIAIGFIGQFLFSMRMIIQWIATEKKGDSVVPYSFWIFSILGSVVLLLYAIHRKDPVFIVAQSFGFVVYFRNIFLIQKNSLLEKPKTNTN